MGLDPIAFDIETSGLDEDAVITIAGFAHDLGESIILNVDGRDAPDHQTLTTALDEHSAGAVSLEIVDDEAALLESISEIATTQINGDRHYLTAYNGETWNGGGSTFRSAGLDSSITTWTGRSVISPTPT